MRFILFFVIIVSFFSTRAQIDDKHDVVRMTNRDQRSGTVSEITDESVKFAYANESLIYVIKKSDSAKITFATGGIEFFNTAATDIQNWVEENATNQLAVLPFASIFNQNDGGHEMPLNVQEECYTILSEQAQQIELQDPKTTNALLVKAGVIEGNIQGFTMGEICPILQVEYVLQGNLAVSEDEEISSSYTTVKSENNHAIGKLLKGNSTSYSSKVYDTTVSMSISDNKGQRLFAQDHHSFWPGIDAYYIKIQAQEDTDIQKITSLNNNIT